MENEKNLNMKESHFLHLSTQGSKIFIETLLNSPAPVVKLVRAVESYKLRVENE